MPNHDQIYVAHAKAYEAMISRQPDVSAVINEIRPYRNLDVLDLGAGSGRLSTFLASEAKSLVCTDLYLPMLEILEEKLSSLNVPRNWITLETDHRKLPISDSTIDLAVSGWSICYLTNSTNVDWKANLEMIISELRRVLKPNGTIIIMETMGTGTETPNPPDFLRDYYSLLESKYGFEHRWIRMDYNFDSVAEAKQHTEFFFGDDLSSKIEKNQWAIVPECAGIWWKHL